MWILHERKGLSPKLNPHKFVGPCVVVRIHNDVIFEIRTSAKCKGRTLHHDRLKPYINNDIPQWAMNLSERVKIFGPEQAANWNTDQCEGHYDP